MVCSPWMPASPPPPPEPADAPGDRSVVPTSPSASALASVGALVSATPVSAGQLASAPATEMIFYDGHCGFCHRAVRWVLKRDPAATCFRFAPLQGPTFQKLVPAFHRATLPDTIVLRTGAGELLVRSDAFIHILRRLGGPWTPLVTVLDVVPRWMRDGVYDFVAGVRHRLFDRPADTCPVLPPAQRARFDD
jgi:predicted DCC family thiol-disulfide oxidoreductase YuxK